jgi:GntR family transcriptional repressor for pyruvate dehydrogenase complex
MPDPKPDSERRLLADELAERIQARILDGTYRPGDRLPPERELAEQLGANRGSVREALKKLEQLRLVEIQQGSGIRVRRLEEASLELVVPMLLVDGRTNLPLLRDLLELREVLVPAVMRLALERASLEELGALARHLRQMANPEIGDSEYLKGLFALQDLGARMTGNRVLLLLTNSLRRFLERAPLALPSFPLTLQRQALAPGLKRLAVAVEARDTESAVRATVDLLHREGAGLLQVLTELTAQEPGGSDPGG